MLLPTEFRGEVSGKGGIRGQQSEGGLGVWGDFSELYIRGGWFEWTKDSGGINDIGSKGDMEQGKMGGEERWGKREGSRGGEDTTFSGRHASAMPICEDRGEEDKVTCEEDVGCPVT